MKNILFSFAILVMFGSCGKPSLCKPATYTFSFQQNKQVDTIQPAFRPDTAYNYTAYQIKEGNKLVFSYRLTNEECPGVQDGGGATTVVFEVPATANTFTIADSAALRGAKTITLFSCGECYPSGAVFAKGGFIEGTKQSDSRWHIKASLLLSRSSTRTINFDNDFRLE